MSCENLEIPAPAITQCPTSLFGIPYKTAGRTVGGVTYPIAGIVLHCEPVTASDLCAEMKCRTKSSVITGSIHNSYHYSIGAATSPLYKHVNDGDISWTWGTYKNNSYLTAPPPSVAINWPTLQGLYGVNVTPDVYTIDIGLAIGHIVDALGCYECPTSSGLQQNQHDILIQLLAYLVQEHGIPIDSEHINFHDHIRCDEGDECPCTDIEALLGEVAAYCPPCDEEAFTAPEAETDDNILYIYGVTEPCCPTSPGCLVQIPWNACFIGDLAKDGDLTSYILGLTQDPVTEQWCLTRGCLGVLNPLIGCGTVDDPLRIDRCLIDDWIDSFAPLSAIQRVMGIDDNGCLTLQENDSWFDMVACAQPENSQSIPEWILAKTDNTCPEFVTPAQVVAAGLTVQDTDCIDLTLVGATLSALPIISPDVGNIITCIGNGLYAPIPAVSECEGNLLTLEEDGYCVQFVCSDLLERYDTGINVVNLHGDDDGGACGNETLRNAWDRMFCEINQDPQGVPIWLAGITEVLECPALVTPDNIVAAGLIVNNTDCINLSFVGNVLTATPAISVDIGGIQNVLSCLGSGMYVPRGANANVLSPIVGNGSDISPLDINFTLLDAQDLCDLGGVIPGGVLQNLVGTDGGDCLRVQSVDDVLANNFNVADTNCVGLTYAAGVLTADPIISPPIGGITNALICVATGLYVPKGANLEVLDTNCIDLTLNNGVLSADIDIDPSGTNQFTCTPNGAFVSLGAGLTVASTDCIDLNLIGGEITAHPIIAGPQGGIPNSLQCLSGEGLYVPETANLLVFDTSCINLTLNNDSELTADLILDPNADNQATCGPAGLYVPPTAGLQVFNTDCIALALTNGDELRATPIIAGPQGGIPNGITCLPGQGLYVANNIAGLEVFFITDDQANTQTIVGADTIIFLGINGATQRITGVDTVTIDGHMLCDNGAPTTIPPYDTDQAWTHYDTSSGITYNWNCDLNRWETPAHITNATTLPDASTCAVDPVINGVTNGVWTPGVSTYIIPGGAAETSFPRHFILTQSCVWSQVRGKGESLASLGAPQAGVAEGIDYKVPLNVNGGDSLGVITLPTMTIAQTGYYIVKLAGILDYGGANFEAALYSADLFVNGALVKHVVDAPLSTLNIVIPGNTMTIPFAGETTYRLNAGDIVEMGVRMNTNVGGQTYDVVNASLTLISDIA